METENGSGSMIGGLSRAVGASEPALRLLITLLTGYPLALIHRHFVYGKPAKLQHLYFISTGLALGYLNYGSDMFHALFSVVFSYLTLIIFRGSVTCVAITFSFNMIYLVAGYYYSSTNDYDINWTMPHCVLVLRLIGTAFDLYDGNQPEESLSSANKAVALKVRPSLFEYFAHMFFPSSFLIGPQFPMKRYHDFVAGEFSDTEDKTKAPNSIGAGLHRLMLGIFYLAVFQGIGTYVTDEYIYSDEFGEMGFLKRCLIIGIWGRITLYKYISVWLLTEGACIMFGLTHNGKDERGNVKWDGLANVDILKLECATEFNHYIQSFNTNTNHWVAQYVYKRLKFLNNRYISQGASLLFLAIWHGFHSGYYVCFFMEFMVMFMEKDFTSIVNKNEHVKKLFSSTTMTVVVYLLLRIYTFVFMGWCLVPFALLTFDKYWKTFHMLNYVGFIFFLPWAVAYGPIMRKIVHLTRPKVRSE